MTCETLVKLTSVGIGFWASGAIASISLIAVPGIKAGHISGWTKQWKHVYDIGKKVMPSFAGLSAAGYLVLATKAYNAPNGNGGDLWKIYTSCAVLTLGIVPYTLLVMVPTNNALEALKDPEQNKALAETTIDKWAFMNLGRSILPLLGSFLALYTMLN